MVRPKKLIWVTWPIPCYAGHTSYESWLKVYDPGIQFTILTENMRRSADSIRYKKHFVKDRKGERILYTIAFFTTHDCTLYYPIETWTDVKRGYPIIKRENYESLIMCINMHNVTKYFLSFYIKFFSNLTISKTLVTLVLIKTLK